MGNCSAIENAKGFGVRGSGLAHGAGRPLIACERGSAGSMGSMGRAGAVQRIRI